MIRKLTLGFCLIMFLLVFGIVRPYPDGPFQVSLRLDGRTIHGSIMSGVAFSTYTNVTENSAGGIYTKTPGLTKFSSIVFVTDSANAQLDDWFNSHSSDLKDFLVNINDGSGTLLESWKFYRMRPSSRQIQSDGKIKYFFDIPTAFERDRAVVMP